MVERAVLAVPGLIEQQSSIEHERSTRRKRLLELGGEGDDLFPHVDGSGIDEPGVCAARSRWITSQHGGIVVGVKIGDRQTEGTGTAAPAGRANKKDTQQSDHGGADAKQSLWKAPASPFA